MSYIPSINIEHNTANDFNYIVTENAKLVVGGLVNGYNSGHHSFTLIGTYGTGKSSFILALENDLKKRIGQLVRNRKVFGDVKDFEFLNIVGDYTSLSKLIGSKLESEAKNPMDALHQYYQQLRRQNKFLFIVIDEFGKILEYAANNNPEKELYFLQKLAEFVNVPSRNIILLTTLHQNFGSYAAKLTETQRNEWQKVKGRFEEVVFAEPVEQLLYLTTQQMESKPVAMSSAAKPGFTILYDLATTSKIVSDSFKFSTAEKLYPLDPISAVVLTMAIQRYGQNERSLFSFLTAKGNGSLNDFTPTPTNTYNVREVCDYLRYHYFSALTETNADSTGWRSLTVALERIGSIDASSEFIEAAIKIIKLIGLLNIFFAGVRLTKEFIEVYAQNAMGINQPLAIIDKLTSLKIIRYAQYKSQYILFEGTNLDLEDELYKAAGIVPTPTLSIEEIGGYVRPRVFLANASYYQIGTPRYFEFKVTNEPINIEPVGEIDGYIHLVFPLSDIQAEVKEISEAANAGANIYAYFKNTETIIKHLHEIKKLQYVIENVAMDDNVAKSELENQKRYEAQKLNYALNEEITSPTSSIVWYFHGKELTIHSLKELNELISSVCAEVYHKTPIIRNELFNKQKFSSAISLARVNLLDAMLLHSDEEDFGFPKQSFPPEKTIYYTLFRDSGIHRQDDDGNWILGAPTKSELQSIWKACMDFLKSSVDRPRKLTELVKILRSRPYKLKQGVIDIWLPIFLYVNQQDYALYNNNTFVLSINKEVFELLQKQLKTFSVKAFDVSGVRLEFFKRYRQFLRKDDAVAICTDSLLETVKPFFHFYRNLNSYAKTTRKFDNPFTAKFRDVLAQAQDPAKTFFEDLPAALGYRDLNSDSFVAQYLQLIRTAVRDLNTCYDFLIDRIEVKVKEHIGLTSDFEDYKSLLSERYSTVNGSVLTPKSKSFLERILAPSENRKEFYEKIAIVVNDKRLDETKDNEEALLVNSLLHLFSELERASSLSTDVTLEDGDEAFNFELATAGGDFSEAKTFRLPSTKRAKADKMIEKLSESMSGDRDLDICVLLKLLNEKLK